MKNDDTGKFEFHCAESFKPMNFDVALHLILFFDLSFQSFVFLTYKLLL